MSDSIKMEDIEKRKGQLESDIQEIDLNLQKIEQSKNNLIAQKQAMQGALALCNEFLDNK